MEKLKTYLLQKNLSQSDFGLLVGVSQGAINRYIRGIRFPEPEIVIKIHQVTDGHICPTDWYENYSRPSNNERAA